MRHERAQEEVDQEQADGHLASMSRQQFQHRLLFIHTKSASKMSWTRRKVMENVMEEQFSCPKVGIALQSGGFFVLIRKETVVTQRN